MAEATIGEAEAISERIRETTETLTLLRYGIEHKITVSIGVASLSQTTGEFDDLLHAADSAMYQAKENGKNQVIVYQSTQ